ncbi:MAG: hypothetical protein JWL62_3264 [Hyphomicrobiales bacterium]|nr:hypothetical protein [Hyphomicrobiales bacterium]
MTTVRTSFSLEYSLSRSVASCLAFAVFSAAATSVLPRVYDLQRSKRAGTLARITALGMCASQLAACTAAFPRDSVPRQFASAAEPLSA